MRKLASIQQIKKILPIAGAERIMEAEVMGWHAIVKKDEFKPGDFCVFFEVDAILPEAGWSEFLRSKKFRIKSLKMKGVLSQGLALPLSILTTEQRSKISLTEGFDCTEILGVKKYEPPIVDQIGGHLEQGGPFPNHVPKTDEERIQSNLEWLTRLAGRPYAITEKMDGTSFTATYDRDETLVVAARNFAVKYQEERQSKHWLVALRHGLREKLKDRRIAIQAELMGPGIQKNCLRLTEPEIFVFNAFDWHNRRHLNHHEIVEFCRSLDLPMVPTDELGETFSYDLPQLLEKAKGFYRGTQNLREGLVVRSLATPRISFKVLNNDFLLAEE